jgi:2-C-methyl-D-erythritol 4-phosphate cytidylyltransferase/2-C-methyl-D-erythritol 2,4-cyclodiphosphate synthase
LNDTTLILLAAGNATRFDMPVKKQWLYTNETPLWLDVARRFEAALSFEKVIIVAHADEAKYMRYFAPNYLYVTGGNERQDSLRNALRLVTSDFVMVHDVARCCVPEDMIRRVAKARKKESCVVPVLPAVDTLYLEAQPLDREKVRIVQTPQLSDTTLLRQALQSEQLHTDDSSAVKAAGGEVIFVQGDRNAHKLTRKSDVNLLACLRPPRQTLLTGFGIDTHAFEENKPMKLCGVTVSETFGFKAHSDGDVAIHALIDALLGAAGMGDIGELFPDTDATYAGADSAELLNDVVTRIRRCGFEVLHTDMTIVAQTPKLQPYKEMMRLRLADLLGIAPNLVNIKATTSEKLGFIGRKEGVTVHAVANLRYYPWKEEL